MTEEQGPATHPRQVKRPRSRFEYRPDGPRNAPVLRCRWCGRTFSGWPGTYNHGVLACLLELIR